MKILVTLRNSDVAPRFDLSTEVLIATASHGELAGEPRTVLLPGPSSDELCSLIIKENISLVICGGIEEAHFQYLGWKKIEVIDRVIGPADKALLHAVTGKLRPGAVIRPETGGREKG
ncbi:NifB/NifX family molybdenum-iron cluster-binding protein [Thiovibrio sp. JS02]